MGLPPHPTPPPLPNLYNLERKKTARLVFWGIPNLKRNLFSWADEGNIPHSVCPHSVAVIVPPTVVLQSFQRNRHSWCNSNRLTQHRLHLFSISPFPYFSIAVWFFDIQNTFHLIVGGLKNAFFMPFLWLFNPLLSDHFVKEQQQWGGIGDCSSWMKMCKIGFRTHVVII